MKRNNTLFFSDLIAVGNKLLLALNNNYGQFSSKSLHKQINQNIKKENSSIPEKKNQYNCESFLKATDISLRDELNINVENREFKLSLSSFFLFFDNIENIYGISPAKKYVWEKMPEGKLASKGSYLFPLKKETAAWSKILFYDSNNRNLTFNFITGEFSIKAQGKIDYIHSFQAADYSLLTDFQCIKELNFEIKKDEFKRLYGSCGLEVFVAETIGPEDSLILTTVFTNEKGEKIAFTKTVNKTELTKSVPDLPTDSSILDCVKEKNSQNFNKQVSVEMKKVIETFQPEQTEENFVHKENSSSIRAEGISKHNLLDLEKNKSPEPEDWNIIQPVVKKEIPLVIFQEVANKRFDSKRISTPKQLTKRKTVKKTKTNTFVTNTLFEDESPD